MRARDVFQGVLMGLMAALRRPERRPAFACSECERWQRCGMPPSDRCVFMLAQIARGDRPVKRLILPPG
jgi:hypothetical protein